MINHPLFKKLPSQLQHGIKVMKDFENVAMKYLDESVKVIKDAIKYLEEKYGIKVIGVEIDSSASPEPDVFFKATRVDSDEGDDESEFDEGAIYEFNDSDEVRAIDTLLNHITYMMYYICMAMYGADGIDLFEQKLSETGIEVEVL